MTGPLVSIIIPCFNTERFLGDALNGLLSQVYAHWEAIIVDDGSTDHSAEIARGFAAGDGRFRCVCQPNKGVPAARNAGLRLARGSYIGFLDADDKYLPYKLLQQVQYLEAHPDVELVYGDYFQGDALLRPQVLICQPPSCLPFPVALQHRNWFDVNTPLLRRSVVDRLGGFDESLADGAEDWDYWIRAAAVTAFAYASGPVAIYRQHEGQIHRKWSKMYRSCLAMARKRYSKGTLPFRTAMVSIELAYARTFVAQGSLLQAIAALAKSLWHARGPSLLCRAIMVQKFTRGVFPLNRGEAKRA